jgi:AraC-like DNA-binding protein
MPENNCLLIVNKDILQRFSTQDCTGDMILFSVDFFGSTLEKINFINQSLLFQSDYAIIHPRSRKFVKQVELYFSLMKIQTDKGQETKLALLRNCLHNLLMIIEREYRIQKKRFDSVGNQTYIQQFRALLDQHYLTEKRVYFYAEKLNISEKKLTQIVSSVHGVSAKEYISEKVLTEAIRLLKNTTLNQGEIADLLGLDFTYFIKFFRKHIGMSPAKYRKKLESMIE